MVLIYVNQFMIYDSEKIMLGYVGFIQEKIAEKGKGSGVLFDEHEFQLPAFLVSVFFDQFPKPGELVHKADEEKQSPQQIIEERINCEDSSP